MIRPADDPAKRAGHPCAGASVPVIRWALLGVLSLHAGLVLHGAWVHSPGWDEIGHLPAGLSHWTYGDFRLYRVNPPLVRMVATVPLLIRPPEIDWQDAFASPHSGQEFDVGLAMLEHSFERSCQYITIARWACIPLTLLAGWVCFAWATRLYGPLSGLLAASLWCFSPLVLANAQMITPDTGAAAIGIAAHWSFWRWIRAPSWHRATVAGLLLGLAQLTKFTWVVLPPLWIVLWAVCRRRSASRKSLFARLDWTREALQLAGMGLLCLYMINAGYGFHESFQRLGDYPFTSRVLRGPGDEAGSPERGSRFAHSLLAAFPVPVPAQYALGIDEQKHEFERGHGSYLRGQWKAGGWWYYYIYALLVKEPLGTWALLLIAAVTTFRMRDVNRPWRDELMLLSPALVVLVLVSSQTGFNHHLRYVLPALPFVFVWISKVARSVALRAWWTAWLAAGALAWSISSSLMHCPHSHAYFNELAGGASNGHAHLLHSNIDWGQDLLPLKRWLDDHPQVQLSGVAYSLPQSLLHAAGPRFQGQKLPPPGTGKDPAGLGPRPGWYVVFVHHLRRSDEHYAYFLEFEPVAMVGYTAYVYHISAEDVKRFHSARCATPSCRASGRASPRSGFGSDVQAE